MEAADAEMIRKIFQQRATQVRTHGIATRSVRCTEQGLDA